MMGLQEPRVWSAPMYESSLIDEAIELCALAGLHLDPWQQFVLRWSLGIRDDGLWSAFEVGVDVSRQNGKGGILEARELVGLFLIPTDKLLIHTAHEFKTSSEHQRRLEELIQNTPEFHKRVKPNGYKHSHGEEGIELRNGKRIRFMTRTKGGGRGFSGDFIALDEAMYLPEKSIAALLFTVSARPNPQIFYTGSAVDQMTTEDGVAFARVRERGHAGDDPRLAWFEHSARDKDLDALLKEHAEAVRDGRPSPLDDRERWAEGNPGLGIRITEEHIASERRSMDPRTFAVERLGVGDWPALTEEASGVLPFETWQRLADQDSEIAGKLAFAIDTTPDRAHSSIGVGGLSDHDLTQVEVVERRPGTKWVVSRVVELVRRHDPVAVVIDGASAAASLVPELEAAGVEVTVTGARDYANACGTFYDLVEEEALRHLGQPVLDAAVRAARKRPLGDAFAWSRKGSVVDIGPLVVVTLAAWGVANAGRDAEVMVAWA